MSSRLFLFTDIHANLPALEAIQLAVKQESPDLVIHLGDAVEIGPHPAEVVSAFNAENDWICLQGNHEQYLLGYACDGADALEVEHRAWTRSQLSLELITFIQQWRLRYILNSEGMNLCFQHYAINLNNCERPSFRKFFSPEPETMDELFEGSEFDMVFFGHLHRVLHVKSSTTTYYGLTATGTGAKSEAAYTIVDLCNRQAHLEYKTVVYDDSQLFADMEARQVPARNFLYQAFYGGRFSPKS